MEHLIIYIKLEIIFGGPSGRYLKITSPNGAKLTRTIVNVLDPETGKIVNDTTYTETPEHAWYTLNI
jgi:hypothetical protein